MYLIRYILNVSYSNRYDSASLEEHVIQVLHDISFLETSLFIIELQVYVDFVTVNIRETSW